MQVLDSLGSGTRGGEHEVLVDDKVGAEGNSKEHAKEGGRGSPEQESDDIVLGRVVTHETHAVHGRDGSDETAGETTGRGGSSLADSVLLGAKDGIGHARDRLQDQETKDGTPEGGTEGPADLETQVQVTGSDNASEQRSHDSRAPV